MSRDQLKGHNARVAPHRSNTISIREITRKYNDMVISMEKSKHGFKGSYNAYVCPKGHVTFTVDRDWGTTPFMVECRYTHTVELSMGLHCTQVSCDQHAQSKGYNIEQEDIKATHEWYRPSLDECLKMRSKQNKLALLDHILNGGLEIREIKG